MANQLGMTEQQAIIVLAGQGWSFRRIARKLGVHRETVARYVNLARGEPPAPAASQDSNPKPAISITGSAGRNSKCEPYRAVIIKCLERGLSAQRIWQDLQREHEFVDGYQSVQRFVRRLRSTASLPFRRMECEPGEDAQIDFGTGAPVRDADGKRRRTHVFRIILSHSRKAYSEAVYRQTTGGSLKSCGH